MTLKKGTMRTKTMLLIIAVLFIMVFVSLPVRAEEGMYLLDQIDQTMMEKMKKMGLELSIGEIHNTEGTALSSAVIKTGATSSFVSQKGLILTNHHVAFGALQRISTPEQNYMEEGFLAKKLEEEIPAHGYQAYVLVSMEDVTKEVLSAVKKGMSDYNRFLAIEKRTKEIIGKAEEKGDVECEIEAMNYGMKYYLFKNLKIRDIRIVYAPARAIGEFGGDVDNWMWPRHTGDFSFLRAYVGPDGKPADYSKENIPYKPKSYFKISTHGFKEGDFTMIMGFPGRTSRWQSSYAVEHDLSFKYPFQIRSFSDLIRIFEEHSNKNDDAAVKLSSSIKGLSNGLKNNQGMLEGLTKVDLLKKKRSEEQAFLDFTEKDPLLAKKYGRVLLEVEKVYKERNAYREKSSLMSWMQRGLLGYAMTINKWTIEQTKKDIDREPGYQQRDLQNIIVRLRVAQKSLVPEADRAVFEYFLKRASSLPAGQKIEAVDNIFRKRPELSHDEAMGAFLDELYSKTRLISEEERVKMIGMKRDDLLKMSDPFLSFASELEEEKEELRKIDKGFNGALSRLMPLYLEGLQIWKNEQLSPDANGTLRFNYGQVKGYSPRDAVEYRYVTSLSGIMEKEKGEEPFKSPEKLIQTYKAKDFGIWVDEKIEDVPVDFLTTNDSTGGNSGSPVLDRMGHLIGVLFDGTYESLYSDYYFEPAISRSIHVDVRYVLFITEKVDKAVNVLDELTLVE